VPTVGLTLVNNVRIVTLLCIHTHSVPWKNLRDWTPVIVLKATRNTCARNARGLVTSVEIEFGITKEQQEIRILSWKS